MFSWGYRYVLRVRFCCALHSQIGYSHTFSAGRNLVFNRNSFGGVAFSSRFLYNGDIE
jgi:hypothetical protein